MNNDIAKLTKFFTQFNELPISAIMEFRDRFVELRKGYEKILGEYQTTNKKYAENFNIFRILGVSHYEVGTHSALLRELLDSQGTHGQGNLFFLAFLSMLADKSILKREDIPYYTSRAFDDYVCETEMSIDTGRVDIIISRHNGGSPFCLIIENKVYACDQFEQITRYWQHLEERDVPENRKKILYLTPEGDLPSDQSISPEDRKKLEARDVLHCISYKKDIRTCLDNVLAGIESPKVTFVVEQYITVIQNL